MALSTPDPGDARNNGRRPGDKVVLEAQALSKHFGGITAVDDVSFALREAEILGIVGDNGAGKSTLIKIITGAYRKDGGALLLNGEPVEIENTRHAREIGLETVYQSSGLVEMMDAPANLFLARELLRQDWLGRLFGLIDKRRMRAETQDLLKLLQIEVKNLRAPIHTLSGGQQQSVAVGRAAYWKGRIIILTSRPTISASTSSAPSWSSCGRSAIPTVSPSL